MKHLAFGAALLAAALNAAADPETYTVDNNHTFPIYEISHMGYSVQRGRFDKTSGKIVLDLIAHTGTVDVSVDTASLDTSLPKLNEHLKGEDFFNVAKYPAMTFSAKSLVWDGDNVKSVTGDFTLLGVTKPVTFEMNHFKCGTSLMISKHVCGADMVAHIKRSDFGMKTYLIGGAIGDDVTLRVGVEAIGER